MNQFYRFLLGTIRCRVTSIEILQKKSLGKKRTHFQVSFMNMA